MRKLSVRTFFLSIILNIESQITLDIHLQTKYVLRGSHNNKQKKSQLKKTNKTSI